AIWGGTLIAIGLLAVGTAVLVSAPVAFANRTRFGEALGGLGAETSLRIGLWIFGFLLFASFVQATSLAIRSRSLLALLDFALVMVVIHGVLFGLTSLARRVPELFWPAVWGAVGVATIAMLAGTLAAVARGRTDVRRAHRAQSLVLWSCVFLGLAIGAI